MEGKLKAVLTETLRRHVNRRDEREIFRVEVLNVLKENWASLRLEKFEIVENRGDEIFRIYKEGKLNKLEIVFLKKFLRKGKIG